MCRDTHTGNSKTGIAAVLSVCSDIYFYGVPEPLRFHIYKKEKKEKSKGGGGGKTEQNRTDWVCMRKV